jgi:PPM family protein phosphatase
VTIRLRYAIRSDVGYVREGNEDSAYAGSHLLVVADGMGGHAAGEVASSTVISRLAELDTAALITTGGGPGPDVIESLRQAMREANGRLRQMTRENEVLEGMGTTVTALLSAGDRLGLLHVGDSRAYLLRGGVLSQVTHDHTLVQDLVDQGRITPEQANTHPQRSLLMRALDGREVDPDLELVDVVPGDRFLLCSDGLSSVVTVETIHTALELATPQEAVDRLVDLALSGGGPDNITVVVADVTTDDGGPLGRPLVAGAAAEKRVVPGADPARTGPHPSNGDRESPAAKGARLGRGDVTRTDLRRGDYDGGPDAEYTQIGLSGAGLGVDRDEFDQAPAAGGPPPRRSRLPLIAALLAVLLIVLIAFAGWSYKNKQYYIGESDGHLAIYRGVSANVPLVHVHNVVEVVPDLKTSDLDTAAKTNDQLREMLDDIHNGGVAQSSRADADAYIDNVRQVLASGTTATTTNPSPTATPTATASASNKGGTANKLSVPTGLASCTTTKAALRCAGAATGG